MDLIKLLIIGLNLAFVSCSWKFRWINRTTYRNTIKTQKITKIIDQALIDDCVAKAVKIVDSRQPAGNIKQQQFTVGDPVAMFRTFGKRQHDLRKIDAHSRSSEITEMASKLLIKMSKQTMTKIQTPSTSLMFQQSMKQNCAAKTVHCNVYELYRSASGHCNNLKNPSWGSSISAQPRFLQPVYGDSENSQLRLSVRGGYLPNPRDISNVIHNGGSSPVRSCQINVLFTHFGQFVDHDIISTPLKESKDGKTIHCCTGNTFVQRPECLPFSTPQGEFSTRCMHFVRSETAPETSCPPGPRNQMNQVTSYLDLSVVYGSSRQTVNNDILNLNTGKLIEGPNGLLPDTSDGCINGSTCFRAGEGRNSEVPLLTVIHILFMREHNRIVNILRSINPHWPAAKLYQEGKKILTGIYQHIVYKEYLPTLLGAKLMTHYSLYPRNSGFNTQYDQTVNAGTRNGFAAAAFRIGHSLIGTSVGSVNVNYKMREMPLEGEFMNPRAIRNGVSYGVDKISRWMLNKFSLKSDRFLTPSVRNKLFETKKGNGFDLSALNIQRGRDHGIPSYNVFRKYCGLQPAYYFGNGQYGFRDMNTDAAAALQSIYKHPNDVDLFVGGLSETPLQGSFVGPTFGCLLAQQFKFYKTGDRFFYENKYALTGFTTAQLAIIKKQSLSSLYCRNLDFQYVQSNAFVSPQRSNCKYTNYLIACKNLPQLGTRELLSWRENFSNSGGSS